MENQKAPIAIALTFTPQSSQLAAFGYDAQTKTLEIWFKSTGTTYHYFDVPPEVFDALKAAPSKGSYFIRNIKRAGFRYQRID